MYENNSATVTVNMTKFLKKFTNSKMH